MKLLVELNQNEAFTDSSLVARKFGMRHAKIVEIIKNVLSDYPDLRVLSKDTKTSEKYYTEQRVYRGQDYTAYMMNHQFFSLVAMRFTSKKARQWQRKFNHAFYRLERQVLLAESNKNDPQWITQRNQTKTIRRDITDAIKEFSIYATAQGSRNADRYYPLITNAIYRALGFAQSGSPKIRDTLGAIELVWLTATESRAQDLLRQHMTQDVNYKDIYRLVADELLRFAEPLSLMVIGLDDQHLQPEDDGSN